MEGVVDLDMAAIAAMAAVAEVEEVVQAIAVEQARLTALLSAAITRIERDRAFADGGHRDSRAWVETMLRCSRVTARTAVRRARVLVDMPTLADAVAAGRVGADQVDVIAALHRQMLCRQALREHPDLLVGPAGVLGLHDFARVARHFAEMADPDGNGRRHDDARRARNANAFSDEQSFRMFACGDTASGVEIERIFNQFVERELDADWAAARATAGDAACATDMPRTAQQRRYDAFHAMTLAAAESGVVNLPDTLIHYVIDHDTYQSTLREMIDQPVEPFDVSRVGLHRCETIDGVPIDPRVIVAASITAQIRRVVFNSQSVVIDAGRRARLFRGVRRELVMAMFTECAQPGCHVRNLDCQIDHIATWTADHGPTDLTNGQPKCGYHNRFGYRRPDHNKRPPPAA